MFDESTLKIDDVKRILQFYESIQRTEMLNTRILTSNLSDNRKRLSNLRQITDPMERISELEKCMIDFIDKYEDTIKDISLFNSTVINIIKVYEKILFSDDNDDCED